MSFQSSTATVLKRSGDLIRTTSVPNSDVETDWKDAMDYSAVSGLLSSNPTGDAQLVVEQSIDGETVDKSETITPGAIGDATEFEIPITASHVRVRLEITGTPTSLRTLSYMTTRASSIAQT